MEQISYPATGEQHIEIYVWHASPQSGSKGRIFPRQPAEKMSDLKD